MMRWRVERLLCCWGLLGCALLWGCGDDKEIDFGPADAVAVQPTEPSEAPAPQEDALPRFVEALEADLGRELGRHLEGRTAHAGIEERLREEVKGKKAQRNDPYVLRSVLKAVYLGEGMGVQGGGVHLGFAGAQGLSPVGEKVLEQLAQADRHALDPARYHVAQLQKAKDEFQAGAPGALTVPPLGEGGRKALEAFLRGKGLTPHAPEARREALEFLLGDHSPSPALREAAQKHEAALRERAARIGELELLVADGFLAWAWDMRYSNPAWQTEGTITPKMTRNEANELLRAALAKDVRGLDPDAIPSFLGELTPRQPQYARLLEVLGRYREVAAHGGWAKVSPKALRVGSTGEAVVELKRRLQQENYFSGAVDDQFGDDLKAAVEAYQEGHQVPVTGVTDEGFWTALKVPVEERIVKVELALQRWRESRVTDDDHYMFVNIPSFYAEAWRGGEIEYRFKVVVGNTDLGCDRKKRVIGRVNATPLFSDEIEAVIVNPYWNVPDRIWKEEILPAAIKDPEYLERKGYVCAKGSGLECKELKQKTGKDNALGQIKFIFPNGYSVYMHDTPKKKYFDRPVRAYSHGCMRVHEPERLAEYLLKADEVWDEALFHKQLEGDLETSYRLKRKIPIHIEYYTVRVDEQGRAQFFGDVYGYDEERLSGEEKPAVRCTPPPDPEIPDPDAVPEELMKDLPPVPVSPSGEGAPSVEDGGAKGSSTAPALDPGVVVIPSGDGPGVERKLRRVPVDGATEGQGEQTLTRPSEEATPKKDAPSKVEPKQDSKKDPKRDKKKDKKKDSKKKKSKKK